MGRVVIRRDFDELLTVESVPQADVQAYYDAHPDEFSTPEMRRAAHIRVGVGCKSCHGRVDQMEVVRQVEPLSMGWCLECHRNPAPHLRPEGVPPTDMEWVPTSDSLSAAAARLEAREIRPPEHCSACHR